MRALRQGGFQKSYRLLEISFKAATNFNHAVQYEYQSRGELSIAGVTNELSMQCSFYRWEATNSKSWVVRLSK
jgi:polyisoprenoid-binding protein YceI